MKIGITKVLAVATCMAVSATAASAATITFNLSGSDGGTSYAALPGSFMLSVDGLDVSVGAGAFQSVSHSSNEITAASNAPDPRIGRYGAGAGVFNSPIDNSRAVDSSGWNDFISLSFDVDVILTGVTFGRYNRWFDDFRWLTDTSGDGSIGVGDFISDELTVTGSYSGFGGAAGRVFAFGAFDHWDSWALESVTFETIPPSAVPLPAGGLLLLSGLFGIAAVRRKSRR